MIVREWELLFSKYDLRAVLDGQINRVDQAVRAVGPARFDSETDEFISAFVASELVVSPLELQEDKITVSSRETRIDVSHDPNRHFFESGPHYVPGVEITYHVPFTGEPQLWYCRPNQYTLNPPRAVIKDGEIVFPIDSTSGNIPATKGQFAEYIGNVKHWLPWVTSQVAEYNARLEEQVRAAVVRRRVELAQSKTDITSLGFPVKSDQARPRASSPADAPSATQRATKRESARRRYDVALSYAGEDREYVEKVADALKSLGVEVFYDQFEAVELWGKDLAAHLGRVYSEDSHFVVMFASRHYAEKAWPTHERQHALGRALRGETERILPVRIDDTDVPGLSTTIGYLDVRVLTPRKLAELIRQKLDSA